MVSSILPIRRARFGTIAGSKELFRSRGTSISIGSFLVDTVFVVLPLRELPVPCGRFKPLHAAIS